MCPTALETAYNQRLQMGSSVTTKEDIEHIFVSSTGPIIFRVVWWNYLDPKKLQIVVVGDGSLPVRGRDGESATMEESLERAARDLGLPYAKLPLR